MSLPPYAHWAFDYQPEAGSPEAEMLTFLQPKRLGRACKKRAVSGTSALGVGE